MNTRILGNRIRDARIKAGLTQAQLAAEVGLTTIQTIGGYEAGRHLPPLSRLASIARVTGLPMDFFTSDSKDPSRPEVEALVLQQQRTIERFIEEQRRRGTGQLPSDIDEFMAIPIVGKISAGEGWYGPHSIHEHLMIARRDVPPGIEPFFLEITGECLQDGWGLRTGDLVCVAPGLRPEIGDLVVVMVDDEAHLKKLCRAGDQVMLASDQEEIDLTPADEAQMVGPVLWSRRYHRRR